MQIKRTSGWLLTAVLLLSGCGDHNNLFGSLADDNSKQAKLEEAQQALDKGDCQTAIDGFTDVFNSDPGDTGVRINLSAAYLCKAGFSVTGLLKVAADFNSSSSGAATSDDLFQRITAQVSALIPDTAVWKASVCEAKKLLGGDPNQTTSWPCQSTQVGGTVAVYNNDPDAAFTLSIVNLVDAVLTVADVLDTLNGIAECVQSEATTCTLTGEQVLAIGNSLLASSDAIVAAVGLDSSVTDAIDNVVNTVDADGNGQISDPELASYLLNQGITTDPNVVSGTSCTYNSGTGAYSCTGI